MGDDETRISEEQARALAPCGRAAAGFLAGGTVAMLGWRRLYRWGLGRGEKAIRNLIGSIAVDIETGGGFSSAKPLPNPFSGFLREGTEA